MTTPVEEDFELELRTLPGVVNVGISHSDKGDVDAVTLFVRDEDPEAVREVALHVTSLYYPDANVTVEDANRAPSGHGREQGRVALVRTEFDQRDGISEVQLSYAGRTGIGRAGSGPLIGGAEATLAALRDLGYAIPFYLRAVTNVDTVVGCPVIVTFRALSRDGDLIGIAQSEGGDLKSAAKATLDAFNRYLAVPEHPEP